MKKRITKGLKEIVTILLVWLAVKFALSFIIHTKMFTTSDLVFLITYIVTSIIYKIIMAGDEND